MSGIAVAALWTVFLNIGWYDLGGTCRSIGCWVNMDTSFDTNSVVTVLLLAPTVAIGVIVRHEESDITKLVQQRYRFRLFLTGASLFAASSVLALEYEGVSLGVSLGLLAATSTATLPFTLASALYSRRRIRRKARQVPNDWVDTLTNTVIRVSRFIARKGGR